MSFIAKYPGKPWILALAFLLSVPVIAPRAQEVAPFQTDGVWKSFDRYKEEQKEKLFSEATGDLEADTKTIAAQDAVESQSQSQADTGRDTGDDKVSGSASTAPHTLAGEKVTQSSGLTLAPPERPLEPPVLPRLAVVSGLGLSIDTTEDDAMSLAHVAHIETNPDLQLPKQNWLDAAEAARLHAEGKDSEIIVPVDVRLSFLPGIEFSVPKPKAKPVVLAAAKPEPPPQSPADLAACAAIDAYKKRQLEAIQSDRHTLSALQAAIAELGLKKQLGFMADGSDAKIDAPENNGIVPPSTP